MSNATLTDDLYTHNGGAVPDTGQECRCPHCASGGRDDSPAGACLWTRVFDIAAGHGVDIRRAAYAADKARPVSRRRYEPLED